MSNDPVTGCGRAATGPGPGRPESRFTEVAGDSAGQAPPPAGPGGRQAPVGHRDSDRHGDGDSDSSWRSLRLEVPSRCGLGFDSE